VTIDELDAEIEALLNKKKTLLAEQRDEKLVEVKKAIKDFGFTLEDLGFVIEAITKKKGKASKTTLPAKYRNPKDQAQTWHGGRGAKPKWVKEFENGGGRLVDIEIKPNN